jgi:hypothetical protein
VLLLPPPLGLASSSCCACPALWAAKEE